MLQASPIILKIEFIIAVTKHTPPPIFVSLLIALSWPKSENQGSLFSSVPLSFFPMVSRLFLLTFLSFFHSPCPQLLFQFTITPHHSDHTSFVSCPLHSHLAGYQSTISLFPCWLLCDVSKVQIQLFCTSAWMALYNSQNKIILCLVLPDHNSVSLILSLPLLSHMPFICLLGTMSSSWIALWVFLVSVPCMGYSLNQPLYHLPSYHPCTPLKNCVPPPPGGFFLTTTFSLTLKTFTQLMIGMCY